MIIILCVVYVGETLIKYYVICRVYLVIIYIAKLGVRVMLSRDYSYCATYSACKSAL